MVSSSLTMRTFAHTHYLPSHPHISKSSRDNLRYALNRWETATENPAVSSVRPADLYSVVQSCSNRSPHTARAYLTWIKILLRHAAQIDLIESVPRFPKIRCRRRLKPTPTLEDLGRMYAVATTAGLTWPTFEPPAVFWRRWLVVSYITGLRLADLMHNLKRECVRPEAVVLESQKSGKLLAVPRCHLLDANLGDAERVFPVSNSPHLIRRELRKLSEAATASVKVTPHGLRRLSITEWSAASESAGRIVHGCGVSGVMASYVNVLRPLERARPDLEIPAEFTATEDRQLRLF